MSKKKRKHQRQGKFKKRRPHFKDNTKRVTLKLLRMSIVWFLFSKEKRLQLKCIRFLYKYVGKQIIGTDLSRLYDNYLNYKSAAERKEI